MSDYHFVYVYILSLRVFFCTGADDFFNSDIHLYISNHFSFLINNIF